ncbi:MULTISPECIES: alkaline phosphatase family protein [unclassified Bradyrhizobium]|uniref:alkaline phosphatase family protein n=1 Tax=unclassified Bradyrhizobium TaxID=2631580 RepID=UPI00247A1FAC|nr:MULTISPECIES: alkaline phosphatase family protein [unclassified Bradyrhizobium]WGS19133.1 alkaline phosphatase family protein [Bradyrhizobium sp. ISRA463]WGS25971.1 alkaline phosphatase family protein [Bradyrhizobium sp. ISRA464]
MSDRSTPNRVLIVLFDGLRPDLVKPSLTPNLVRLQRRGAMLARQRTVYPSETRIALTSLVTGTTPDRHGIVGNEYLDRLSPTPRYVDTGDARLIEDLDAAGGGHLFGVPSLGEVLQANGRTLSVLASNSAGATCLLNHRARKLGHVTLSGHFPHVATSTKVLARVETLLGPTPAPSPPGVPDLTAQAFLTSAFLDVIWPQIRPDVAILSFGEPDISSHDCGTGAPKTLEAISFVDRQFGRVLDWWEAEGEPQGVHLMAISDHGHVTVHARADLLETLEATGLCCGPAPAPRIDAIVIPGQVGAIYLAEPSDARIRRAVAAMIERPWCGPVFTAGRGGVDGVAPGSFARHLVFADHARSADILFSFRADDGLDPFGLGGRCWSENWPIGVGVHGGLHAKEMSSVGILAGSQIKSGFTSQVPSGICDLAPTVLRLLGISQPSGMTGRSLTEVFIEGGEEMPRTIETSYETSEGAYRQNLRRVQVGAAVYLDAAAAL